MFVMSPNEPIRMEKDDAGFNKLVDDEENNRNIDGTGDVIREGFVTDMSLYYHSERPIPSFSERDFKDLLEGGMSSYFKAEKQNGSITEYDTFTQILSDERVLTKEQDMMLINNQGRIEEYEDGAIINDMIMYTQGIYCDMNMMVINLIDDEIKYFRIFKHNRVGVVVVGRSVGSIKMSGEWLCQSPTVPNSWIIKGRYQGDLSIFKNLFVGENISQVSDQYIGTSSLRNPYSKTYRMSNNDKHEVKQMTYYNMEVIITCDDNAYIDNFNYSMSIPRPFPSTFTPSENLLNEYYNYSINKHNIAIGERESISLTSKILDQNKRREVRHNHHILQRGGESIINGKETMYNPSLNLKKMSLGMQRKETSIFAKKALFIANIGIVYFSYKDNYPHTMYTIRAIVTEFTRIPAITITQSGVGKVDSGLLDTYVYRVHTHYDDNKQVRYSLKYKGGKSVGISSNGMKEHLLQEGHLSNEDRLYITDFIIESLRMLDLKLLDLTTYAIREALSPVLSHDDITEKLRSFRRIRRSVKSNVIGMSDEEEEIWAGTFVFDLVHTDSERKKNNSRNRSKKQNMLISLNRNQFVSIRPIELEIFSYPSYNYTGVDQMTRDGLAPKQTYIQDKLQGRMFAKKEDSMLFQSLISYKLCCYNTINNGYKDLRTVKVFNDQIVMPCGIVTMRDNHCLNMHACAIQLLGEHVDPPKYLRMHGMSLCSCDRLYDAELLRDVCTSYHGRVN